MSFPVTLNQAAPSAVSVTYATSNGTAVAPSDYTAKTGTLTILAGASSGTITVTIRGDVTDVVDETFNVTLNAVTATPVGSTIIDDGTATGTIVNNDIPSVISVGAASIVEGHAGTKTVTISVTLDKPAVSAIVMTYATSNGTATAPADYTAKSGSLTIATGATSGSLTFTVVGDSGEEPDETFNVGITIASGPGAIHPTAGTGNVTITNDDVTALVSVNEARIDEGNSGTQVMTFNVRLDQPATGPIKFDYVTGIDVARPDSSSVPATPPSDFATKAGTLTIPAGQTEAVITVNAVGDAVPEERESFLLTFSNLSGPAALEETQAVGFIENDDPAPFYPVVGNASAPEGASGTTTVTFEVNLLVTHTGPITFGYTTVNGTATAPSDFTAKSGTLTIPAGQPTGQFRSASAATPPSNLTRSSRWS